jgi:superfamily II DNA/RNA helicase
MNILSDLFSQGDSEKVVIFSQWERMTRLIAQELTKRGIGFANLHGGVPSRQRADLIKNFWDDPDCRVFLSTDAGSTGLNLQSAATIINLDLPWNPAVLEQRIARIYRLGQQRNVQVINLVSAGTIEEQMLDKLRFKSAMFEGVLDNGQDAIFLGEGSKLTQMMETLGEMVEEEEKPSEPVVTDDATEPATIGEAGIKHTQIPSTPNELIAHGTAFLSGLAATLKYTEATEQLVNSLVETDAETGKTTLKIPIPDKQTVRNLLDIVGKLFG